MAVTDLVKKKVATHAVKGDKQPAQPLTPDEERSLVQQATAASIGGLSAVGNLFDTPGSMVRDVLTWAPGGIRARNPLDQLLSPLSSENRTSERELLQSAGLQSKGGNRTWGQAIGRFAAEVGTGAVLDPLSYIGVGLAGRALGTTGKIAKRAGLLEDSLRISGAGKRVASQTTTLRDLVEKGGYQAKERLVSANRGKPIDDLMDQPLGGLATIGLPFMKPLVLGTGDTAQRVASNLDTAGEAIRFGKYSPVRALAPVFQRGVRGTQSGDGQRAAIALSEDQETALTGARELMYRHIVDLHKSDVLKGDRSLDNSFNMLEYLEDIEPDMPDDIRNLAKPFRDAIDQRSNAMRLSLESITKGRDESLLTPAELSQIDVVRNQGSLDIEALKSQRKAALDTAGFDYRPKLNADTAPLQNTLDALKGVMKSIFKMQTDAGVAIDELDDPIEYFARLRQTDAGPMRMARDRNSFKPSDAFAIGRDASMRGMLKGTALLQKMSIDPEFAGIASAKKLSPDERSILRNSWRQKYGLVQQETMFSGDDWQRNTDRLFDKITRLDRTQVERGIPMFATNPAEVALRRLESAVRSTSSAIGVRKFLNHHAMPATSIEGEDTVALSELFGTPQGSKINQGHTKAKQLMIQELGDTAELARDDIWQSRKAKLVPDMVRAQLDSMGVQSPPAEFNQQVDLLLKEWEKQTGEKYDTLDDFFGPDWENAERARINNDEILANLRVPKHVAEDASRVVRAFATPEEVSKLTAGYDTYTNWFKTNVTSTAPSFHFRNAISGFVQNLVTGAINPLSIIRTLSQSMDLLRGKAINGAEDFAFDPYIGQRLSPEKASDELRKEVFSQGILDSPGQHNDLVASASGKVAEQIPGLQRMSDAFKAPEGTKRWENLAGFWKTEGVGGGTDRWFAARWGRGIGNAVESFNRVSAYVGLRKQGYNPKQASDRVKEIHVDYSNLSDTERRGIRRAVPFYSFTKGMVSHLVRELNITQPRPMTTVLRGTNMLKGGDTTTPDYVLDTTSIPLGTQSDGSDRYLTGLGLMHEAPLGLFPTGLQDFGLSVLSQLNPAVKAPLEYATGQSFFQQGPDGGRPLSDTDPLVGRLISNARGMITGEPERDAVQLPRWLEVTAANSPLTRYLSTARSATDPRKSWGDIAMANLSGARITDVSPEAQGAILRERSGALIDELGGEKFVRQYIPERVLANLSPEDRKKAELWIKLQKKIDTETKQRAKARAESAAENQPVRPDR